jgi:hypothetical protein
MNPAGILAALKTVEQDHQMVLDKVQALRQAVEELIHLNGGSAGRLLKQLQEIHAYFATQFEAHMEEEETTLLPLLETGASDGPALVARLRQEHEEIRRMRTDFGNCLDVAGQLADRVPRTVLRELMTYAWELWDLLDRHAYNETRAVHLRVAGELVGETPPALDQD